jgi:hypothetical protein
MPGQGFVPDMAGPLPGFFCGPAHRLVPVARRECRRFPS